MGGKFSGCPIFWDFLKAINVILNNLNLKLNTKAFRLVVIIFLLSFFLFCATYFSPRKVYAMVLKLCMGSYVAKYIRVFMKKKNFGDPPYALHRWVGQK